MQTKERTCWDLLLGSVSRSQKHIGPEKPVIKLQFTCFEKPIC